MPDDEDGNLVNVQQVHEARYWAKKFNVSRDELKSAVEAVGPWKSAVAEELEKRRSAASPEPPLTDGDAS